MKTPRGFKFSGVSAGIKPSRKDLALVLSDAPCTAAGCFTANKATAAPVVDARARLPASDMRAIVLNSGNANALTGPEGVGDVRAYLAAIARELELSPHTLLAASTGVIGVRLPTHKLVAAAPALVRGLRPEPDAVAEAILTTDTRVKMAWRTARVGGQDVTLSGIAKGSGMIHPQLSTVLCVLVTDCAIAPALLQQALRAATDASFNQLTIDGDMSTNDAVLALANGAADHAPIEAPGAELTLITTLMAELCRELAKEIAADGEGATKLLEVTVSGAPTVEVARDLSRAIASSPLVKAAMFGADPNWGRVLATIGARAGSRAYPLDPAESTVRIQGVPVYADRPVLTEPAALRARMRAPELTIDVELRAGAGQAVAWGCDLSYDYVKINADYSSLIVQTEGGGVAKDDRLTNYSPAFKVSLLVEALSYISRFSGRRCVIKYGGAAMVKESLKRSFCHDVLLLRSVGLKPIVVHGGGPELTRTLEKLGGPGQPLEGGASARDTSDLKVIEMVMTGSINAELVTLLNRDGPFAVGLSGKDGGLLRAKASEGASDASGEVTQVNRDFLEMLLKQDYVPVISPIALGADGRTYEVSADDVAAQVAASVGAAKLIYLTNVSGVLDGQELLPDLSAAALAALLADGRVLGGMAIKARAVLRALTSGGVERVHIIDGRTPHGLIAELFTDRGVGTLVTP